MSAALDLPFGGTALIGTGPAIAVLIGPPPRVAALCRPWDRAWRDLQFALAMRRFFRRQAVDLVSTAPRSLRLAQVEHERALEAARTVLRLRAESRAPALRIAA